MAILKLRPACKDYLWGGTKLIREFGKDFPGEKLAETWELSCHPDGPSMIENGEHAENTLNEYILKEGKKVLGTKGQKYEEFPLLIKFIDAKDDLSVQVHPNDTYALKNEGQYGKTEMWYVVESEEGASLYYGFSREISGEEQVSFNKGDSIFMTANTGEYELEGNFKALLTTV